MNQKTYRLIDHLTWAGRKTQVLCCCPGLEHQLGSQPFYHTKWCRPLGDHRNVYLQQSLHLSQTQRRITVRMKTSSLWQRRPPTGCKEVWQAANCSNCESH